MKTVCPACTNRTARIINDDCPACHGHGTITLHPAALTVYEPETVAAAITIAIEAAARNIDTAMTLTDDQQGELRGRVTVLEKAGIILNTPPAPAPAANNVRPLRGKQCPGQTRLADTATPTTLAAQYGTDPPTLFDDTLINATPHQYAETDRPMMRGLPILSAAGHPSSLARITDPVDQLQPTSATVRARKRRDRQAAALLEAAPAVPHIKDQLRRAKRKKTG